MKRLIFLVIVVLLAAAAAGAAWWARQSLPILDGELGVAGLTAPVEILADDYGVPHVYAAGAEDAWLAAGLLHARDRLWQMELYRRAAYGRLSEVLGEQTLPIDKRLLTLGLRGAAEAEWRNAPPAVRLALARYTQGVNEQIAQLQGRRLPLEFQILRYTPAPWTEIDSLAVGRLLAWRLAENHQAELVRHALASRFGPGEAQRLTGSYPDDGPTILSAPAPTGGTTPAPATTPAIPFASLPMPVASPDVEPRTTAHLPRGLEWLAAGARRGNSNNWVVAGRRTTSGRPLVANDPHLQIEFPSVWYEQHIVAAGLDVAGVSIPGVPFVVLGHNGRIAWGMTNTGADVQDLYVDRFDVGRRRYYFQGQWLPVDITRADIPVRGGDAVPFEVWRTRHGTVFAEAGLDWDEPPAWLSPGADRAGERRAFTLRWESSGDTAAAFELLNRAGNWSEFVTAIERFTMPSQNIVYADVDGNIGYAMSGVLPLRSNGDGSMPRDGSTGEGDWVGRIDPKTLPRAFNPPEGYISSSNNEIDRRWPGVITRDWTAPFRAARLREVFSLTERLGVSNATQLQLDVTSRAADVILKGVETAIASAQAKGADYTDLTVLERLRTWDRRVDNRSVVALFEAFEDALWRRTFRDEMGDPLFERFYEWAGGERPAGLYAVADDRTARWFDDISTIDRRETRDEVYLLAARDAVDRLNRDHEGPDTSQWSEMHAAHFDHPLGSAALPLAWLFNRGPSPITGDGTTVMRSSFQRPAPFRAYEIASWRQVLDVGNWDESRVVLPGGQSGHPLSSNYFDQNKLWREGQFRPQPFSRSAVDAARAHRLLLVPR